MIAGASGGPGDPLGQVRVEASELGVTRLHLSSTESHPAPLSEADRTARGLVARALSEIAEYAAGRRTRFDVPVDLSRVTAFQRTVYEALLEVPFGGTASYGEIARRVGCRSARAIGQAVGRNPVPILVPCHRIVTNDGRLGGFSGGLGYKVALLGIEGIQADGAAFRSPLSLRA